MYLLHMYYTCTSTHVREYTPKLQMETYVLQVKYTCIPGVCITHVCSTYVAHFIEYMNLIYINFNLIPVGI